ncbi:MAG: hypothetical protein ACOYEV_05850 [Candidatus Nanopelagicales bacterium]
MNSFDTYSRIADAQLDALEVAADADLYNAVLQTCALILRLPQRAQALSTPVTTPRGTVWRLPVLDHPPYCVYWAGRIELIYPSPPTSPAACG